MTSQGSNPFIFVARIPIVMEAPPSMHHAVAEVLSGEYEAGFFGERLTILDLGANVGAFALWANARWPGSTIHSYEPHPGTFELLRRNTSDHGNVFLYNAAVYPTESRQLSFVGRFSGDGEAGLQEVITRTFTHSDREHTVTVDAVHPSSLPLADIVKIDVEGAEAAIIQHLDLSRTSLLMVEYQNDENRDLIKRKLASEQFAIEYEDEFAWSNILKDAHYRGELDGDHYGLMFFSRPGSTRLLRRAPSRWLTADEGADRAVAASVGWWRRRVATLLARSRRWLLRGVSSSRAYGRVPFE
jgi:FkbM family methyltransferase